MCGGDYEFKKPLCEVRGEKLVEKTIRLLKENNADDIVISTNHNGLDIFCQEIWQVNDIFKEPGNYTIIDDYTTDVDSLDDIKNIENVVKFYYDEIPVFKLQAIESFTLERKGEIKNINKDDIFECRKDIADYLLGDNSYKKAFVKILELKQ